MSETEKINKEVPRVSDLYLKEKALGKTITYMCQAGLSRSVAATRYAYRRGEKETSAYPGGLDVLFNQTNKGTDLSKLLELLQSTYLRVIVFNKKNISPGSKEDWITRSLKQLEDNGSISNSDFDVIELTDIMQDLKSYNKKEDLLEFTLSSVRSSFND